MNCPQPFHFFLLFLHHHPMKVFLWFPGSLKGMMAAPGVRLVFPLPGSCSWRRSMPVESGASLSLFPMLHWGFCLRWGVRDGICFSFLFGAPLCPKGHPNCSQVVYYLYFVITSHGRWGKTNKDRMCDIILVPSGPREYLSSKLICRSI